MDKDVVAQKLESLRRCLQRLALKCPSDPQVLVADLDLQDIVALNLSRAVQISVDIGAHLIAGLEVPPPDTMGQTFDVLAQAGVLNPELAGNLKKSVGFRNIAVHNYERINWLVVHNIVQHHLVDFIDFATIIGAKLDE